MIALSRSFSIQGGGKVVFFFLKPGGFLWDGGGGGRRLFIRWKGEGGEGRCEAFKEIDETALTLDIIGSEPFLFRNMMILIRRKSWL
jgi:hypothetical protein